jgi:hypothetical protein
LEQLTPEQFISQAMVAMPDLSSTEAFRIFEHASSWTTVFYDGDVPPQTATQLHELEIACRQCLITQDAG